MLEAESGLTISSPDFEPGDPAPKDLTCDGKSVFPTLEWEGPLPANGKELALTLTDQTNPNEPLLLWLVAGLSPSTTQVNAGLVPDDAVETLNDYGKSGFGDPCIEADSAGKDLQFRLHVLSAESGIKADAPGNEAYDQVTSLSIDSTAILVKLDSSVALAAGTD